MSQNSGRLEELDGRSEFNQNLSAMEEALRALQLSVEEDNDVVCQANLLAPSGALPLALSFCSNASRFTF